MYIKFKKGQRLSNVLVKKLFWSVLTKNESESQVQR